MLQASPSLQEAWGSADALGQTILDIVRATDAEAVALQTGLVDLLGLTHLDAMVAIMAKAPAWVGWLQGQVGIADGCGCNVCDLIVTLPGHRRR